MKRRKGTASDHCLEFVQAGDDTMQALTSAFLGCRLNLRLAPAPKPNPEAPRQVTVCAKKKGIRCIVTLECTEARGLGATPSRYTTQKARIIAELKRNSPVSPSPSRPRWPGLIPGWAASSSLYRHVWPCS